MKQQTVLSDIILISPPSLNCIHKPRLTIVPLRQREWDQKGEYTYRLTIHCRPIFKKYGKRAIVGTLN